MLLTAARSRFLDSHIAARPETQWLFNLADDPTEQVNLAETRPDKVSELKNLLDAHAASSRPPLYEPEIEVPSRSTNIWRNPSTWVMNGFQCRTDYAALLIGLLAVSRRLLARSGSPNIVGQQAETTVDARKKQVLAPRTRSITNV